MHTFTVPYPDYSTVRTKRFYPCHVLKDKVDSCTPIFTFFFIYYVCLFCSQIIVNIIKCNATVIQVRGLASIKTKPGLVHHFLHKKMPIPSQEYDSCYPFVLCV